MTLIEPGRSRDLLARERATHESRNPGSRKLFEAADHLFGRVPMTWMNKWAGGFPLYQASASGNRITDVDGNTYVDFALGDTASMAGHSPAATVAAVTERISTTGGITTMLPTENALWVAEELQRHEMKRHGEVGKASARAGMDRKTGRKYVKAGKLPSEPTNRRCSGA